MEESPIFQKPRANIDGSFEEGSSRLTIGSSAEILVCNSRIDDSVTKDQSDYAILGNLNIKEMVGLDMVDLSKKRNGGDDMKHDLIGPKEKCQKRDLSVNGNEVLQVASVYPQDSTVVQKEEKFCFRSKKSGTTKEKEMGSQCSDTRISVFKAFRTGKYLYETLKQFILEFIATSEEDAVTLKQIVEDVLPKFDFIIKKPFLENKSVVHQHIKDTSTYILYRATDDCTLLESYRKCRSRVYVRAADLKMGLTGIYSSITVQELLCFADGNWPPV